MKFEQHLVIERVKAMFGEEIANNKLERNFRFIEETLELVQSLNMTKEQVLAVVEYTFNRPIGEPQQELGGVLVTLFALCGANNLNAEDAFARDMSYCKENSDKIREKRFKKPKEIRYEN